MPTRQKLESIVTIAIVMAILPVLLYGQWSIETADTTGTVGVKCAIAVDENGYPHISYRDGTIGWGLKYAHWDGSEWQKAFVETSESVYGVTSIALDGVGNPHIAFEKGIWYGGQLWHAWWDGSNWQQERVDSLPYNGDVGEWNSIAFDSDSYPHIAYTYYTFDGVCYIKYAYKDVSGWHIQVVDSIIGDEFQYVSMALDDNNNPHISYYDWNVNDLKYASLETIPVETLWTKTYGGSEGDCAYGVQIIDGGYLMCGDTRSFGAGNQDLWLIRVNEQGDTLWTDTYGGWGNDRAPGGMEKTSDGGYIIGGTTHSFSPDGTHAMWLVKLDYTGGIEWDKSFSTGEPYDYGKGGAKQTFDGGYILCGESYTSGHATAVFFAVKTNSLGNEEWRKTYGDPDSISCCRSVVQTPDSGFIFVGYTNASGAGGNDVYLVRTYPNGDTIWTKTYGGSENDYVYSIQQTTDGNYIVAGNTNSFGTGIWVLKVNSTGGTLWTKVYDYYYSSGTNEIKVTLDNGYIIVGSCRKTSTDSLEVYLIKTDQFGDTLWTRTCGGDNHDRGNSVIQTLDEGYVVAGGTQSYGESNGDAYLIKFGSGESTWHIERVDTTGAVGNPSSIAIDSLDYPHIAYWDWENSGVKYARWDGADWQFGMVEPGLVFVYNVSVSMELDAQNHPHITYIGEWNSLKYAHWDGANWHTEVVDSVDNVWCEWTSLAIDGSGNCHIAYNDGGDSTNLKYAKRILTTGVEETASHSIPEVLHLTQNYPNPFNSATSIQYILSRNDFVRLIIYNISGQLVRKLVKGKKFTGTHTVSWNGRDEQGRSVSNGIYFYCLETGSLKSTRKMLLLK